MGTYHSAKRLQPFGVVGKPATYSTTAGDLSIQSDAYVQGRDLYLGITTALDSTIYSNSVDATPYFRMTGLGNSTLQLASNAQFFRVYNNTVADAGNTTRDSPAFDFVGHYWDGGASVEMPFLLYNDVFNTTAPRARLRFSSGGYTASIMPTSTGAYFQGGPTTGNICYLKANETDATPYISLTGLGAISFVTGATTTTAFSFNGTTVTQGNAVEILIDSDVMTTGQAFNVLSGPSYATSVFKVDKFGNLVLTNYTAATAGPTHQDSPYIDLFGSYWTGAAASDWKIRLQADVYSDAPPYGQFKISNTPGNETIIRPTADGCRIYGGDATGEILKLYANISDATPYVSITGLGAIQLTNGTNYLSVNPGGTSTTLFGMMYESGGTTKETYNHQFYGGGTVAYNNLYAVLTIQTPHFGTFSKNVIKIDCPNSMSGYPILINECTDDVGTGAAEVFRVEKTGNVVMNTSGTTANSPYLSLVADVGGTSVESRLQTMQGADPYLRISVTDDSATPALVPVFDVHDTVISFVTDNAVDIGATGANRPKDLYLSGNATVGGRILGAKGTDVASANDMTLTSGNYFDVTGAVQINGILITGWTAGSVVVLQFDGAPTVKHNTAASANYASLMLAGAGDFLASAGDTLTLVYDGTYWRETARTVI